MRGRVLFGWVMGHDDGTSTLLNVQQLCTTNTKAISRLVVLAVQVQWNNGEAVMVWPFIHLVFAFRWVMFCDRRTQQTVKICCSCVPPRVFARSASLPLAGFWLHPTNVAQRCFFFRAVKPEKHTTTRKWGVAKCLSRTSSSVRTWCECYLRVHRTIQT